MYSCRKLEPSGECRPFWNTVIPTVNPLGLTCLYERKTSKEGRGQNWEVCSCLLCSASPFSVPQEAVSFILAPWLMCFTVFHSVTWISSLNFKSFRGTISVPVGEPSEIRTQNPALKVTQCSSFEGGPQWLAEAHWGIERLWGLLASPRTRNSPQPLSLVLALTSFPAGAGSRLPSR